MGLNKEKMHAYSESVTLMQLNKRGLLMGREVGSITKSYILGGTDLV